jgi:hypothetical protein
LFRNGLLATALALVALQLIDLSINQTLGRTVATSLTVVLSILPLALIGGEVMRGFGLAIIFGIIIGTSSSIFIASPILLLWRETAATGGGSCSSAEQFRCGTIKYQIISALLRRLEQRESRKVSRFPCPGGSTEGKVLSEAGHPFVPASLDSATLGVDARHRFCTDRHYRSAGRRRSVPAAGCLFEAASARFAWRGWLGSGWVPRPGHASGLVP